MSSWGTGYVPPNAEQAGAARHRTERWEPQAEGKQQEGTFKPLIKNQPHQSTRGTQVLEAKAPASRTQSCLGSSWTLSDAFLGRSCSLGNTLCRGHCQDGLLQTGCDSKKRPSNLGPAACYREWPFLTASILTFLPLVRGLGYRN